MNISTKVKQNVETNKEVNNSVVITEEEANVLSNVNLPFYDMLSGQISSDNQIDSSNSLLMDIDFNYDSLSMDFSDAMFFVNLTREGQFSVNTTPDGNFETLLKTEVSQNIVSQKSVEVTNQLTALIEKAQSTQKPVRISFDNDVSVILKIDKNGKVTAEFIPGSLEVENFLRNNIASLRQKFDEQNLPYNDLFYRQNQNGKQNKNRNKDKGEQ